MFSSLAAASLVCAVDGRSHGPVARSPFLIAIPMWRESCSDENAGMVVPSHFIPLAAPGVIAQGLKWMLNPKSPFYLRPRLDPALWSWCWQFFRHANARHVEDTKQLLADFSLESRRLFLEWAEELQFDLTTRD